MKYPKYLLKRDTIGVCAPSSGASGEILSKRMDNAILNVEKLAYKVVESPSVRYDQKCVSAKSNVRAEEFMALYENPSVAAIIPPWGGEFLMDILPLLDFERLATLPGKWVCGYSDLTTLLFPLTLLCDLATVHGSNFLNMGFKQIHASDMRVFDVMAKPRTVQRSWETKGGYTSWNDFSQEVYTLSNPSIWKSLQNKDKMSFSGRMIGGCMDVLCKLIGTRFAPVETFLEKYKSDGFIWTLESCEMDSPDIYRTLWQMRECGWFQYCRGIVYGRPDGYEAKGDFLLLDALQEGLGSLDVPVIYDADIGHIPPQMQIINGSYGQFDFDNGGAVLTQELMA